MTAILPGAGDPLEDELGRVARTLRALPPVAPADHAACSLARFVRMVAEEDEDGELRFVGRDGQQGPDVDGVTYVETSDERPLAIGDMVSVEVVATEGIDLVGELR